MPRRETTVVVAVAITAVVVLAAAVAGRFFVQQPRQPGSVPEAEAPPGRARYDCLIIRDPAGPDDVVTSSGFPKVHSPDEAEAGAPRATPAAARREQLLGTTVGISVYELPPNAAESAVDAAFRRIRELSRKLNIFSPESDVSRVNREAGATMVKVDDDLYRLIVLSAEVAELSGGAFDATVGPLTALWRKYRREEKKLPPADEVERARKLVGWRGVTLTEAPGVVFGAKGMSFDFGGIAKGFAAEEAAKVLRSHGVRSAIIDCGGDLKILGHRPGGTPFRVGINDPVPGSTALRCVVEIENASIVTSGNYEQFTVIDGRRFSHIIDPRTGQSIPALPSVTVVGPDSAMCDALATAVSVLGETGGLALIDRVNAKLAGK